MDGYTAWKIHRAVKLHLLTAKYNLFDHNGATKNTGLEKFLESRNRNFFELLAKKLPKANDLVQFYVGNIAYAGHSDDIYELAVRWERYMRWCKNKASMTKVITDQLDTIVLGRDLSGNPPKMLTGILTGHITPETAVAINRVIPFTKEWKQKDYFGVGLYPIIVEKLDRFVKYNTEIVNAKIADITEVSQVKC